MNADLFRLLLVAALCLQSVFWIWLFIERRLLAHIKTHPSTPRWVSFAVASTGPLLMIWFSRGLIHWAREDGIGDAWSRRILVASLLITVIVVDLFRVRSKEWNVEGEVPVFWRARWMTYCLLLPLFVASVLRIPVAADPVSRGLAQLSNWLVEIPVLGFVLGLAAMLQMVVTSLICATGLFFLKHDRT